ncbi:MAG: hypothetical protein IJ689_04610 [Alphaproteobacteria bacterium]|nr:hypothetical protein [Alphaproteobacteria bacterium]
MPENKKTRADERFAREAKMLQRNLEKRKKQQQELDSQKKQKEAKDHGQTKD